jgi:hypothetical protein
LDKHIREMPGVHFETVCCDAQLRQIENHRKSLGPALRAAIKQIKDAEFRVDGESLRSKRRCPVRYRCPAARTSAVALATMPAKEAFQ